MEKKIAVGISSGGLDSLLAIKVVQKMGFQVVAMHFSIGFEPGHLNHWIDDPSSPLTAPAALQATGARVEVVDIRDEYFPLLANPPHGTGAHCNPCIDCHAMMLNIAMGKSDELDAAFVFTGEVLGQRPMSQNRQSLDMVARISGLGDKLLRPLSGALLPPTAPEKQGIISRKDLLDIQGRSRTRQIELAAEFSITDYPAPAGGCLLTDENYCSRLEDLFKRRPEKILQRDDPLLLFVGRHIILPQGAKVIIGRNERENGVIERFAHLGYLLEATRYPGPVALVERPASEEDILAAARLCARYGKGRSEQLVEIMIRNDSDEKTTQVQPGEPEQTLML